RRIASTQDKLERKQERVAELEATDKTHTKMYVNEVEMLARYKRELAEMPAATVENAPQEITEFSITNGNHLAYLIYDHLRIKDRTYLVDRSKKRSTAAGVLEMYYEEEPALEPLASVAEYTKLLTTYIRPYLGTHGAESSIEVDGRLHSNFKAGGTSTGRYSSSSYNGRSKDAYVGAVNDANYIDAVKTLIKDDSRVGKGVNLQNIPTRSTNGKRVRNAFVPRDGFIFIGSDLGQIEPRIQAHIMYTVYGDNSMRQIFVDGIDLYTAMAMRVFGYEEKYCVDDAYDPTGKFKPRSIMKTGILAKSYGQSSAAFARNVGIPQEVADEFFVSFDEEFPSFTKMVEDTMADLRKNGFVETLYGRKRRFPDYKRLRAEVQRNEKKLMGYYIERKQLNGKKERTARDKARLAKLEELIAPLADKRNLVSYWERAAFNARIQGTGADILKRIGNRLARECMRRGWEFNASIHDEVKFSLPIPELNEGTIELVHDIMTKTSELSVPLVTDTVIETRWMDAYKPTEWDFERQQPKGSR
uniref:DNA polymerase A family protein n=1 Tax=Sporosarcina koreensis TaxID=334735 RepID=UPI000AB907EE